MRGWWLVAVMACGGYTGVRTEPLVAYGKHRLAGVDAAAIRAMLVAPLELGGLRFSGSQCQGRFGAARIVQADELDAFALCFATLHVAAGKRFYVGLDLATFTYGPGIEIEAMFTESPRGPEIHFLGYVARADASDALPTVTEAAFRERRIEVKPRDAATAQVLAAELLAKKQRLLVSWVKACVDATGAITSVRPKTTSSLPMQQLLIDDIKSWKLQPIEIGGAASPVCAMIREVYPADVKLAEALPLPVPSDYANAPIVYDNALGTPAGPQRASGFNSDLQRYLRRNRIPEIVTTVLYCLDPSGKPERVTRARSSGVPSFDLAMVHLVEGWQFPPYLVDGVATRVCTHHAFFEWTYLR